MCGIFGVNCIKGEVFVKELLETAQLLSYRGYDSSGIAWKHTNGNLCIKKSLGDADALKNSICDVDKLITKQAIIHERWATNGSVTESNAHPHTSYNGEVTLVHNGIITNCEELCNKYGIDFKRYVDVPDTKILADCLGQFLYKHCRSEDHLENINKIERFFKEVEGQYAIIMMYDDRMYVTRRERPIVIGTDTSCNSVIQYITSDEKALPNSVKKVFYPIENCVYDLDLLCALIESNSVDRVSEQLSFDKEGFDTFMEKEVHDQINSTDKSITSNIPLDDIRTRLYLARKIWIMAEGTSYHAGLFIKHIWNSQTPKDIEVITSSEFALDPSLHLNPDDIGIFISQSGETADTILALKRCINAGMKTLSILNTRHCSMDRLSDYAVYINSGNEQAVASTKAYTKTILAGLKLSPCKGYWKSSDVEEIYNSSKSKMEEWADIIVKKSAEPNFNVMLLGMNCDKITAEEGSLKFKELTRIPSSAYSSLSMKHGPLATVNENTIALYICTQDYLTTKNQESLNEIKARGATVFLITDDEELKADNTYLIPTRYFNNVLSVIPLQLLSMYTAKKLGLNVDRCCNLAKSVTV